MSDHIPNQRPLLLVHPPHRFSELFPWPRAAEPPWIITKLDRSLPVSFAEQHLTRTVMRSQASGLQPAGLLKRIFACSVDNDGRASHLPRRSCLPTLPSSAGEEDRPVRLIALAAGTKSQPRRQQRRMVVTSKTPFAFPLS